MKSCHRRFTPVANLITFLKHCEEEKEKEWYEKHLDSMFNEAKGVLCDSELTLRKNEVFH